MIAIDKHIITEAFQNLSNLQFKRQRKLKESFGWERIDKKQVQDSDGFWTDYTLWYNSDEDRYMCIFGDDDLYNPMNAFPDFECETEEEAREWFDSYNGFADDEDEYYDDWMDESLKESNDNYFKSGDRYYGGLPSEPSFSEYGKAMDVYNNRRKARTLFSVNIAKFDESTDYDKVFSDSVQEIEFNHGTDKWWFERIDGDTWGKYTRGFRPDYTTTTDKIKKDIHDYKRSGFKNIWITALRSNPVQESLKESTDKVFVVKSTSHHPFYGWIELMDKIDKNGEGEKHKFTDQKQLNDFAKTLIKQGYKNYQGYPLKETIGYKKEKVDDDRFERSMLTQKIFYEYPDISSEDEDYLNSLSYKDLVKEVRNRGWDEILKLDEDTVKQGKHWVNKGDSGKTHGKFATKKAADAQRKAMFANGYKESLKEESSDSIGIFHNDNGIDYEIIERSESGKNLLLRHPRGSKWIVAWNCPRTNQGSWGQGHYFFDEMSARKLWNKEYANK